MARQIRAFRTTVTVGGTPAVPQVFQLALPVRVVSRVDVRIPPGPLGTVGIALAVSGVQLIPYDQRTYIVGDDDRITYDLTDYPDSGDWQLLAYNQGTFPHTIETIFHVEVSKGSPPSTPTPIDFSSLAGVVG